MKKLILATCIVLFTSFCTKENEFVPDCAPEYDWSWLAIPAFQGNCYLVTNAQIRWLQTEGYMATDVLAPDNNNCPTKTEIESYAGSTMLRSAAYTALSGSNCSPIGYFYGAL